MGSATSIKVRQPAPPPPRDAEPCVNSSSSQAAPPPPRDAEPCVNSSGSQGNRGQGNGSHSNSCHRNSCHMKKKSYQLGYRDASGRWHVMAYPRRPLASTRDDGTDSPRVTRERLHQQRRLFNGVPLSVLDINHFSSEERVQHHATDIMGRYRQHRRGPPHSDVTNRSADVSNISDDVSNRSDNVTNRPGDVSQRSADVINITDDLRNRSGDVINRYDHIDKSNRHGVVIDMSYTVTFTADVPDAEGNRTRDRNPQT